ncbi:unnamed protein product [Tilletia controversa]|uniref:Uncharacterized protein n=3 Tax=Tilletia TaxID=13289 RepID=A0A8X7SZI3_9BASI|nr:hypothetical protein CF336_g1710 [Tilletia laevis]KAE8203434.1 hypothetical protein CF328_g1658 [Tilletia controversa]KAE8263589.1 hypothetical protein A4X03_0g1569 [Tilletia caries]KAE8207163.1 hypothetical protein CF335_g1344 [Tilletia laevis]KAE8253061.1 hypothetical protein A4X06_0g1732 [Tilletia controversa]
MAAVHTPSATASASPRIGAAGAGGMTELSRSRSSGSGARRRSKSRSRATAGNNTPAFLIIALLGALVAIAVLAVLIGPELYAFYYYHHAEGAIRPPSFAAFLSMRMHERAQSPQSSSSFSTTRRFLIATRSRILASHWAREVQKQWSQSILASLPSALAIPGITNSSSRSRKLTLLDHLTLLIFSPHSHLPWPLSLMPGLFRLAAALSLMPIALIGVADFAGYAVFRTLGLQRRRVRIKRTVSSNSSKAKAEHMAKQHDAMQKAIAHRQNAAQNSTPIRTPVLAATSAKPTATGGSNTPTSPRGGLPPVAFPGPGSGPVSPLPGEAGGAPLLTPGAYDAEMLLRHRARSRSTSGTESADAEAEWARTGGSFARVSAVREAAKRARDEAVSQGVTPLSLGPITPTSEMPPSLPSSGTTAAGGTATSPGPTHASLVSPPASPRTRFFRLRLPGVIGQEGPLGMADLTDFEDSGPESGASSPVNSSSRASSISSATGQSFVSNLSSTARPRNHRPRIGGFTPMATPSEEDALRSYTTSQQQRERERPTPRGGAVASSHTSDGESEDAGDGDVDDSNTSNNPRKHGQFTGSSFPSAPANANANTRAQQQQQHQRNLPHQPPSAPSSPSVRKAMLPDPNVLTKTLRSIANVARLALTPGPMDPDAARLSSSSGPNHADHGHEDEVEVVAEGEDADSVSGNLLGLRASASGLKEGGLGGGGKQQQQQQGYVRPRRTSLFGDEEINSTYSGAGLYAGLRSADLEI